MTTTAVLAAESVQAQVQPGVIDFGIGQPQPTLLPLEILRRAAQERLAEKDPSLLAYGHEQGDGRFRNALATFLSNQYRTAVSADQLMVTAGASQALDLVCTLLTEPGDVIFVEEPTYFLALRIFADHGLQVVGIPTDAEGIIPEALEEQLAHHQPKFLYTIPTFQNPSGVTLPRKRRERLVKLSQYHGFLIVADEVYQLLNFGKKVPKPFARYIESNTVLSIGSFSKILAPGLRLGWLHGPQFLLRPFLQCGLLDSGASLNQFTSNIVRVVLESGWQTEYLEEINRIYSDRADFMGLLLRYHLGERVTFHKPKGGYFYWVTLRDNLDTAVLQTQAPDYKVGFQPGHKFSSNGRFHNTMRLSYAYWDSDQIEDGIVRLSQLITQAEP